MPLFFFCYTVPMHFLFLALIFLSTSIFAQTQGEKPHFTVLDELESPFDTPAKKVFYSGLAATVLLLSVQDEVIRPSQKELAQDKPLGKFSKFGDAMGRVIPNIVYAGTMFADYLINKNLLSGERALLMTKATLYSSAVTTVLKYTVQEPRPNGGGSTVSFPSGHTTTAFAFASVVGAEHDLPYGIAAYSLASFVGFSRMNDNMHWVHDVVAGATIGASYGLGLYHQAKMKRDWKTKNSASSQSLFQILPTNKLDGAMGLYVLTF